MKVFIAGPIVITKLDKQIEDRLHNICNKKFTILVGDANGVDALIQEYLHSCAYKDVFVFTSMVKARNNIGNWKVNTIEVPSNLKGRAVHTKKDEAMAEQADYGFMIWNGKSEGTLTNIVNLLDRDKKSLVYFTPTQSFESIDSEESLKNLLANCSDETSKLYNKILNKKKAVHPAKEPLQMSFIDFENAREKYEATI